jgi:hypothetical protein
MARRELAERDLVGKISVGGDVAVDGVKGYHSGTVKDVVVRVRRSRSLRWGGCRNVTAEPIPLRREGTKKH